MREAEVPEFAPPLLDPDDPAAIRAHLDQHGFAVVPALSAAELAEAEDLLWANLEGREEAGSVTQRRPVGWKREDVASWREGYVPEGTNDGFLYSTCHCRSMWHVRSRPGVQKAFAAAYDNGALVAAFDGMSITLPTASGNTEALRVAASFARGRKFGVQQPMHTHAGRHYRDASPAAEFYAIVTLMDMNAQTGATALVPGSHRKVAEITRARQRKYGEGTPDPGTAERLAFASDVTPFTSCGLRPVVTSVKAGSAILFDTRLFHGGVAAQDPTGTSGREQGRGPADLLRAIYILGAMPASLQTPEILAARRKAYELDLFWPLPRDHADIASQLLSGGIPSSLLERPPRDGYLVVRKFGRAPPEWRDLIDPTWRANL